MSLVGKAVLAHLGERLLERAAVGREMAYLAARALQVVLGWRCSPSSSSMPRTRSRLSVTRSVL
ncbi:MAG: hypothetical protein MZV65_37830 [Chromatiales bacterium]|nr:hypothetical protein [Chromatiales bacterium]